MLDIMRRAELNLNPEFRSPASCILLFIVFDIFKASIFLLLNKTTESESTGFLLAQVNLAQTNT